MGGFLVYRAGEERSWVIPRIESVAEWLEENESEHAGPTALQVEFREVLERARGRRGDIRRVVGRAFAEERPWASDS
jgi:hypothetical protein